MPTYEYRCKKCRKSFDWFQTMSSEPLKKCIHCKGPVERQIGAGAGIIFKGSGFYQTDYKNSGSSKKSKPSSGCS
ncbi:MAG: FmdB family zinc ribbon protein, partial [Candidatus Omnitrophota bacterium]